MLWFADFSRCSACKHSTRWLTLNAFPAQAAVSDMLYKAQALISSSVAQDGATIASVQAQMAGFIDQFARLGAGPTKWAKLVEFLKDMYPQVGAALRQCDCLALGA